MTDVDYEALAKAGCLAYYEREKMDVNTAILALLTGPAWEGVARAVVAALREQGMVVVRAEDALNVKTYIDNTFSESFIPASVLHAAHRLADLAEPGDGGEESNG